MYVEVCFHEIISQCLGSPDGERKDYGDEQNGVEGYQQVSLVCNVWLWERTCSGNRRKRVDVD